MNDNPARQAFEEWKSTLPKCADSCDGDLEGMEHQPTCPMFGKEFATHKDAFEASWQASGEWHLLRVAKAVCGNCEIGNIPYDQNGVWVHEFPKITPYGTPFSVRNICDASAIHAMIHALRGQEGTINKNNKK